MFPGPECSFSSDVVALDTILLTKHSSCKYYRASNQLALVFTRIPSRLVLGLEIGKPHGEDGEPPSTSTNCNHFFLSQKSLFQA
jgi:hypothetical protein